MPQHHTLQFTNTTHHRNRQRIAPANGTAPITMTAMTTPPTPANTVDTVILLTPMEAISAPPANEHNHPARSYTVSPSTTPAGAARAKQKPNTFYTGFTSWKTDPPSLNVLSRATGATRQTQLPCLSSSATEAQSSKQHMVSTP